MAMIGWKRGRRLSKEKRRWKVRKDDNRHPLLVQPVLVLVVLVVQVPLLVVVLVLMLLLLLVVVLVPVLAAVLVPAVARMQEWRTNPSLTILEKSANRR